VLLHVRPDGVDEALSLLLLVLHCVLLMLLLLMPLLPPPAVNYTASEVASSEHAVMQGNRTWTLYRAQADYAAAADICSSQGLQLVSLHSADDNAALAALAAQYPNWSAGFAVNGTILLGLRFNATAQAYVWQDASRGDWSPFGSKGLPPPPEGKECVAILADGWWQPVSCTRLPASFACQSGDYGLLATDYPQFKLAVNNNTTSSWAELWRPDGDMSINSTNTTNDAIMMNATVRTTLEECFVSVCYDISQRNITAINSTHASYTYTEAQHANNTSNISASPAVLSAFMLGYPTCLGNDDGKALARYLLALDNPTGFCVNASSQGNITGWLLDVVRGAGDGHASPTCGGGQYVSSYVYATANFSMSLTQYPSEPAVFLRVTASVDPMWQVQQMQQQRKMIFWQQALMPVEPALFAPPTAYGLPTSYFLSVGADNMCATNGIRLPLYGGTAMFYPRVVPAADGGAYLEVWGHADTADMDPVLAAGRLGPGGWMRSAVKFISQLPAGVY
jgi:hypothetical protein